jgi:hypothetical protein
MNRSPWIYQQINGKFGLNCNKKGAQPKQKGASKQSGGYFYIVSALGPRYVDIQDKKTNPGTAGIPIIADAKNNLPTNSQLWKFVPDGKNDGYGYIQSKSGLVLDIKGAKTTAGTPVIACGKDSSESANQLWKFVPDGKNDGHSYIQSKSGLVLDIPHSSTNLRTPLFAFPKNQSISPNQIWIKVSQL